MTIERHPRHVLLGAIAAGLAAAGAAPASPTLVVATAAVVLAAGAVALARAGRRRSAALVLAALAAFTVGAAAGQARVTALDRTVLPASFGHAYAGRVTVVEAVRQRAFGLRTAMVRLRGERVLLRVPRTVPWKAAAVGEVLGVRGGLRPPGPIGAAARAHAELQAEDVRATGLRRGGAAGVVDGVRARAEDALGEDLPPPAAALVRGMVLGQDGALSSDMRDDFRASGLSHLVAASGANVMLLAALAMGIGALIGIGRSARLMAVLVLIALYVPLAGAGPSIQRAGVMGAAGIVAALAGRPASRWYAFVLAALVTLALEPRACTDAGWQLSFAAVLALVVLAPGLRERMTRRGVPAGLAEATAVTLAASLATAPLLAAHFGRVSLVSLPANVLAVPAVAPVMWLGMLAAAVGQVSAAAAAPLTALAGLPAGYVAALAAAAASAPAGSVSAGAWTVAAVCAVVLLAFAGRDRLAAALRVAGGPRVGRRAVGLAAALAAILLVAAVALLDRAAPATLPDHLRLTFLDVGQGDATLVQHGGAAALVDTGPPDGPVLRRLKDAGVRRLDLLVITHAQADHDGRAPDVLRTLPVAMLLDGRDGVRSSIDPRIAAALRDRHVRDVRPEAGMRIRLGPAELRVLSPRQDETRVPGEDPNQRAIVLELRDGRFRALLTADAESDVLSGLDLRPVDVLKVSHHGSADEGLAAMLPRLAPRVAVVPVGRGNTYGHPVPATMSTLQAGVGAVYRTDRDGSVRIDAENGRLEVKTGV